MEDKRIINQLIENNEERVEAVPGPAIVISKETYKKMQENNQAKQYLQMNVEKIINQLNLKWNNNRETIFLI